MSTDWFEERKQKDAEMLAHFHNLMRAVTKVLDKGPWKYTECENMNIYGTLTGNKMSLSVHLSLHDHRIRISGEFPEARGAYAGITSSVLYRLGWKKAPVISVAPTKTAEAIARDIERRLLVDVETMTAAVRKMRADTDAHETAGKTNAERLSALLGKLPPEKNGRPDGDKEVQFFCDRFGTGEGWGNIKCRGDKIEIVIRSIDINLTEKILNVLTGKA